MRIYARMEPKRYADYIDMATDARVPSDGAMPEGLPEVDPTGVLAENEDTLAAIEAEAARAPKRGRQTREAPTTRDDAPRAKRRAAPATGEVAAGAAEPVAAARVFDLGNHNIVAQGGDESWGVVGQTIRLHNSFWGWDDGAYSECRVIAYAGAYTYAAGAHSRHTYVIECEGHYYPATHGTIADALTDATVKRRVRKAGPPRLL